MAEFKAVLAPFTTFRGNFQRRTKAAVYRRDIRSLQPLRAAHSGLLSLSGPGMTLAVDVPVRVQIPVPPSATSRLLYELLVRVHVEFRVASPFRIACKFLPGSEAEAYDRQGRR
jgi:hypothetical protein